MKIKNLKRRFAGFTLIELLVVIAIIGILGAIVYAPFQTARRKGRDAQRVIEMKNLYAAILLYSDSNQGQYPLNLYILQTSQGNDKLPSKTNTASTTSQADLTKYNYVGYTDGTTNSDGSQRVIGFHLFTHLETASPALTGAAKCWGTGIFATNAVSCNIGAVAGNPGIVTSGVTEPVNNAVTSGSVTGAYFTDRTHDNDTECATGLSYCIYDLRG